MRISDWSSDVCSSDLHMHALLPFAGDVRGVHGKCPCPVAAEHHVRDRGHPGTRRRKRRGQALAVAVGLASERAINLLHARIRLAILVVCRVPRSEEHTSELQSLMRISYAVFCLKKKKKHL